VSNEDITRRDFVTMTMAAGLPAAGSEAAAQQAVTETNVDIRTADGTCDAAFIHPAAGSSKLFALYQTALG
jgi:carboxymethylenebutenolidase